MTDKNSHNPITDYAITKRDIERLDFLMNLQIMLACEPLLLGCSFKTRPEFLYEVTQKINELKRRQEYTTKLFDMIAEEDSEYEIITDKIATK